MVHRARQNDCRAAPVSKRGLFTCLLFDLAIATLLFLQPAYLPVNVALGQQDIPVLNRYDPQSGDLILMRGSGWRSKAVLLWDRKSPYSHAGIVYVDSLDRPWVIHAAPGWGVLRVSFDKFLAEKTLEMVAVYRPQLPYAGQGDRAGTLANKQYLQHVPFDDGFDHTDRAATYCSELIYYAYLDAGLDLTQGLTHRKAWPVFNHPVMAPGVFSKSDEMQLLGRFPDDLSFPGTRREADADGAGPADPVRGDPAIVPNPLQ